MVTDEIPAMLTPGAAAFPDRLYALVTGGPT